MQVAFLIDGGFYEKKFEGIVGRPPEAPEVRTTCDASLGWDDLRGDSLFRIYYYDCFPFDGTARNPISGEKKDFTTTSIYKRKNAYLRNLKLQPRVAFRSGSLSNDGWKIPSRNLKRIIKKLEEGKKLSADDLVINLRQKKVDIKIGLDIAWLSSKRIVEKIVLVTGDSDLVPAMKFARREGIMVYLC